MIKALPLVVAAAFSLAACENKVEEVDTRAPDPQAEALKNAPKVELPPAILASVSLRCKDNSLIYVDFFQGEKQAQVKTEKTGAATMLKAPEAGQPYVADGGYKLTGSPKSVDVTVPGWGTKSCRA